MSGRVFAIGAHPDDIEFVMAGTLMRLSAAGFEIHYMNLANGCCGSADTDAVTTARVREQEARRAAAYLGATFHESLSNDLEIFYDRATLLRLASIMRQVAPKILLVHSPQDYMEDHTNACRLAVTAAFSRGMPNFPVQPPCPPVGQDVTVYHAQPHGNCDALGRPVVPDWFVDIEDLIERKRQLLSVHESQKTWLDESQGMDSYLATMQMLGEEVGRMSGRFRYAEGWRQHAHWGFCAAQANPLAEALGSRVAQANTT